MTTPTPEMFFLMCWLIIVGIATVLLGGAYLLAKLMG